MKYFLSLLSAICIVQLTTAQNTHYGIDAGNGPGMITNTGIYISGNYNTSIGYKAGAQIAGIGPKSARYNVFLGHLAGTSNTSGGSNTFLGASSGKSQTIGWGNTFLGQSAGYTNTTGIGNVFIGNNAGFSELGSNKLYIDNSDTSSPLIYGDFATNRVAINGSLGIGTNNPGSFQLAVEGKIGAREIQVTNVAPWPDYVFANDYQLRTLPEVERFIQKNHHLPDVPSAKVVEKEGIEVGKMNATLLRKIEELTLHLIAQNKALEALKQEVKMLKKQNQGLQNQPKK